MKGCELQMWTKICGVTRLEDAVAIARAGASAIGLNFYPGSRRYVSVPKARPIAEAVRALSGRALPLDLVGVFVNMPTDELTETVFEVGLTAVQFHGDESVDAIGAFHHQMPQIRIIRALRVSGERLEEQFHSLDELQQVVPLAACLLDAFASGEYGGTGMTVDPSISQRYLETERPKLILAGGLTPENVGPVSQTSAAWGVDTASGVESAPGIKDVEKCLAFIRSAAQNSCSAETRL